MSRPWWQRILALVITAFRDGALFVRLDYAEGAAEINTSPKTWGRMVHEMREAGLIEWERMYEEVSDGPRYRDRAANLYKLGPVLLEHQEALLEGTAHPGYLKRRQWEARTLRAAARRARRAREVEYRSVAQRFRDRWAVLHPEAAAEPVDQLRINEDEDEEGAGPHDGATKAATEPPIKPSAKAPSAAGELVSEEALEDASTGSSPCPGHPGPGFLRHLRIVTEAQTPRALYPLKDKVTSLPAPGPGAVPSARPTAPGANKHPTRERLYSDTPRDPRLARTPGANPPLSARTSPAAGSLDVAATSNAGSSSRSAPPADPRPEGERPARAVESPEIAGLAERLGMSPAAAAALAAVAATTAARRGSVCPDCSGLGTLQPRWQSESPRRCGRCDGKGR